LVVGGVVVDGGGVAHGKWEVFVAVVACGNERTNEGKKVRRRGE
jgi:hypothetical protein